jgi:hypothetical protein
VLHVHADPAAIFENAAFDAVPGGADDHLQPALLARPPDIGRFPAQGSFIKVPLRHGLNYSLHLLIAYAKMFLYELITERTEKWATPTFLLVIHSAARFTELEIGFTLV